MLLRLLARVRDGYLMNIDFNNLPWYGWVLLALCSGRFLNDLGSVLRYIRRGDVDLSYGFSWSIWGLVLVFYMLVTP